MINLQLCEEIQNINSIRPFFSPFSSNLDLIISSQDILKGVTHTGGTTSIQSNPDEFLSMDTNCFCTRI